MKSAKTSAVWLGMLLGAWGVGCGSDDQQFDHSDPPERAPLFDRLQRLDSDLGPGARGEAIRAVHDYLATYGYFPNSELAEKYPAWRPIVLSPPEQPDVWDEHTTEAVLALQSHTGLQQTGIVDQPTRLMLRTHRCGVPEGLAEPDGSEKFALGGTRRSNSTIRWGIVDVTGPTRDLLMNGFTRAKEIWEDATSLDFNFSHFPLEAHIPIRYRSDLNNTGALAETEQPPGGQITINNRFTWSMAVPTPAEQFDLWSVFLHEIGHALGLKHSSLPGTAMFPSIASGTQVRSLSNDDRVAISTLYDTWIQLPGQGRDIAVGLQAWKIGNVADGFGGWGIEKWNASTNTWIREAGNGFAARIAVECVADRPWVVTNAGGIFRRTASNPAFGAWEWKPGCGTDIAVGCDGVGGNTGSVWSIGCNSVPGGFNIQKWNGSSWDQDQAGGGAVRIAVDEIGRPWVVNSGGLIFRRTSNSPFTGVWELLPGGGRARDIGVGGGYAWVIGTAGTPGGFTIHVWNEQPAFGSAPFRAEWVGVAGGATNIAVDGLARPWVVNDALGVFRNPR